MEGIKFLDDADVKSLFEDNDEPTENQGDDGTGGNVTNISNEEAADIFNNNGKDSDEEDDSEKDEEKVEQNTTKQEEQRIEPTNNQQSVDFSSIAKQFADEGILELNDEEVKDADSFKSLIKKAIENGIDEKTKRVSELLDMGADSKDIKEFEDTIEYLHGIQNEDILAEGEDGDNLRRRLIMQDLINNGVDEQEAVTKVKEIFKKGSDITEAKKALQANKDYFQKAYKEMAEEQRKKADEWDKSVQKQTEELKTSIMSDDKFLGELDIDEKIKKQALANLSEPKYKDKQSGQMLTAIQRYERENKTEFLKNLGLVFTLTDGFKNMDKLVNKAVKRRVNNEISGIEDLLKNPSGSDASLSMVTGANDNRLNKFTFGV